MHIASFAGKQGKISRKWKYQIKALSNLIDFLTDSDD